MKGFIFTLEFRFCAVLFSGVLVVSGLMVCWMVHRERQVLISEEAERAVAAAGDLTRELEQAILAGKNCTELRTLIDTRASGPGLSAAVFRKDGSLYYGKAPYKLPAGMIRNPREIRMSLNGRYLYYKPLFNTAACVSCHPGGGRLRGVLAVTVSMREMDSAVKRLFREIALMTLLAAVAGTFGLILFIRRAFIRPLGELRRGAELIGAGELGTRLGLSRRDEFGVLASAFNRMAGQMESSHGRLKKAVQEQTRDFQAIARLSSEVFREGAVEEVIGKYLDGLTGELGYGFCSLVLLGKEEGDQVMEFRRGLDAPLWHAGLRIEKTNAIVKLMLEGSPALTEAGELGLHGVSGKLAAIPIVSHQVKRCTEIFKCANMACPAYSRTDGKCWLVEGSMCRTLQVAKEGIRGCLHCRAFSVMGLLVAGKDEISGSALHAAEIFARSLAAALENQRMHERRKEEIKELVRLHDLSTVALHTLDTGELTRTIASVATSFGDTDASGLWVAEGGRLVLKSAFGLDAAPLPPALSLEDPLIEGCLQTGELAQIGAEGPFRGLFARAGFACAALVPLKSREAAIGLLALFKKHDFLMSDSERAILMLYANQAASSIEIVALYEELNGRKDLLRESEQKYRNLIETANDAIFVSDIRSGTIVNINRKALALLGCPAAELIGKNRLAIHPPEEMERYDRFYRKVAEKGEQLAGDLFIKRKSGGLVPVEISASAVQMGEGMLLQAIMRDVTERKQSEKDLRDSEHKFRSLAESASSGIFICSSGLVYANSAFEKITGYKGRELPGGNFYSLIHPEFGQARERLMQSCGGERLPVREEFRIITGGGEERWVDFTSKPIVYKGAQAAIGTIFDITERKRMEEALREIAHGELSTLTGEDFFRSLVGYLAKTLNLEYALAGEIAGGKADAIKTMAFYSKGSMAPNMEYQLTGTPCETVLHHSLRVYPEGVQRLFPTDGKLRAMGVECYVATPLVNAAGDSLGVLALMDGRPMKKASAAEGLLQLFAVRASAELERWRSEEEMQRLVASLTAEKEFSEAIFNSTASGVLVLDGKGVILRVNQPGADILHEGPFGLEGRHIASLDPPLEDMLSVRTGLNREVEVRMKDGGIKPIGFINSPLMDSAGRERGVIVIFRDLTEIRKLQTEIRKKQHFESMGRVISGVAHEIRNPLFAIQAIGQLLERELVSAQHQALIQAMLKETARMRILIEELLLYSRPSALNRIDMTLDLFFEEVRNFFGFRGKTVSIMLDIPPLAIHADKDKIKQVFLNLIENAAGAMSEKVEIRAEEEDGFVLIRVRDYGTGIREEDMERVFDPFFTTKKEGTGLGLPICRKIVEEHGGQMEIASKWGAGTEVLVKLPAGNY